ncbi:MAG TPA: hypothetical protein DFS52_27585 [Myxococcales bacterium]|nr:hypothetical protein [Myxococcales bacterium]
MNEKLELLLAEGIVDEVHGRLKSGKEAEVWIVSHAGELAAAKIYFEREARRFRNNADYKEGRAVSNSRTARAMARGSRFGRAAAEEAWRSAEADVLFKLHAHGVRTPKPLLFFEGVLLMELVLDAEGNAAPRLIDAAIDAETAAALYRDLRAQAVRMLDADLIHGDLSPYNVLLAAAGPVVIDFPQAIAAAHNSRSEFFFRRDLENVRQHLLGFDRRLEGCAGDAREIWRAYSRRELTSDFVPTGRAVGPKSEQQRAKSQPPMAGRRTDVLRRFDGRPASGTAKPAGPRPQEQRERGGAARNGPPRQGTGQPATPDARGPANPNARGSANPNARGSANPNARGSANPNARGPANPSARGPANPSARGPANRAPPKRAGPVVEHVRRPVVAAAPADDGRAAQPDSKPRFPGRGRSFRR